MKNLSAFVFLMVINVTFGSNSIPDEVCIGTNDRLIVPTSHEDHYRQLRARYTNCTYVDGNLEITWVQDSNVDLSFFMNIREVTGYVLISHVDVARVVLPRLQIIRGEKLFKVNNNDAFALFVTMSQMLNLEMPALREIIYGNVGFYMNYNLCHVKTIDWDEIISEAGRKYSYVYNFTSPERVCPDCDRTCEQGCWGDGPKNCQRFSKTQCSPKCWSNRCFGPNPHECCHSSCIGRCSGPRPNQCFACRHYKNDGECVSECPSNKYSYAGNCVSFYQPKINVENDSYSKICKVNANSTVLDSNNIDNLKGCIVIEGSLAITDLTFTGYQKIYSNFTFGPRVEPMHPEKLEILNTVKEITGYLSIVSNNQDSKNLSYLRNLEIIHGRSLTDQSSSLYIVSSSLTSLGLDSLRIIVNGSVFIANNKNLCYTSTINWEKIKFSVEQSITLSGNKDKTDCIKDGMVCDKECSMKGCWGPSPSQCVSCKNVILDDACAMSCNGTRVYQVGHDGDYHKCKTCPEDHYFDADTRYCSPCDPECQGCRGLGSNKCIQCKNFKLFANPNDIYNQSAEFTCVNKCSMEHQSMKLCFNNSFTTTVNVQPKSSIADEFIIVNTNAVDGYKLNHDESNSVCKGSDPHSCKSCKYVRDSIIDFLKPFPKYRRISSE